MERTLQREYYISPRIFELEREQIFYREWFCGGRDAELVRPGDYRVIDVAGESILLVRTSEGRLVAHYNVCRHRGSRLVPAGSEGCFSRTIRCPYHSWTYSLEGELRTAPFLDEADGLHKGELRLFPVAVETWGGFFFLQLSPEDRLGYQLADQLGGIPGRLSRYPLNQLQSAHRVTYEVRANWKVILENYNECYHCGPVHPELCRLVPSFRERGGSSLDWERGIPHRDGAWTFTVTGTTTRKPFEGLDDDERVRHKGELIYPNLMLSLSADHVAAFLLLPDGADRTIIVNEFLFHPSEMAEAGFDPGDAIEFWETVNLQDWRICESVQQGMRSRMFRSGYYAPMESASLDIRRYVGERVGES
jgi:glycine betaine catabolism A